MNFKSKKVFLKIFFLLTFVFLPFFNGSFVCAEETSNKSSDLQFTPEVGFPGFQGKITVNGGAFGNFVFLLFNYLIYLSGIFATIMIIVAGFQWVLAGGNQSKITQSKNRIINALIGLFLCFASVLILGTINPDLIKVKNLNLIYITPVEGGTEEVSMSEIGGFGTEGCPDRGINNEADCSGEDIASVARELLGKTSGPCHCACYVSGTLKKAGCGNSIYTSVQELERVLSGLGWERKTTGNTKKGDVIVIDGHIGLSLGSSIIESGIIHANNSYGDCTVKSTQCSNYWHKISSSDGRRLWTGGSCISNQIIREQTTNWFASKPSYRYWVNPKNK